MNKISNSEVSFWAGKRVFLTGHTGFKGAWATIWLESMGAQVFGYSQEPPTNPSLYQVANVKSLVAGEVIGDICNYQSLNDAIQSFKPEFLLHMAAQPLVRYSYDHPVETYMTNVMGTVHVLEAIRQCKSVRSVVIVTTDKCYENYEIQSGYKEEDPMGGYDPYSSSKGCVELVVSAWRRSYFSNSECFIASARAGNVIGGGDWAKDRLVPDFMRHFSEGKKVLIRSPDSIRPWQHVLEPLSGYFMLLEKLYQHGGKFASAWNFGPFDKDARNVRFIADKLSSIWGKGAEWGLDSTLQPHEAKYLKLSIDKSLNHLNWRPILDIEEALKLTCEWYKNFYQNGSEIYNYTLNQIKNFEMGKKSVI